MEGVSKGQSRPLPMLPSSSRLSPLAKPFSLKRDQWQHVQVDASNPSEGDWMSYSGFSGLPLIPSLDLDKYLNKERNDKEDGILSQSCEKGSVSAPLIGPQPYSSLVSCILDEYGTDRVVEDSNQLDCAINLLSPGSCGGFHPSDSSNGWRLQKDDSSFCHQEGFHFMGKDAINLPDLHVDMKKGHRAFKESKLLDETCNSISTDSQMKFKGAEHEQEDAKLPGRASDVAFLFEELVAGDWEYTTTTKGTSFNSFGGRTTALSINHDCESSVSCQSWLNQLVSSPGKHVVPTSQNIDHLQTQASVKPRSDMDLNIAGVEISKPLVMDSLPAVKCNTQLIEHCVVHVDAEKEAEGIESLGNRALQLERIKLGHDETENGDSDVDSPCWKGQSFHQSHLRAPGALDAQNPETKPVTKNSLNPLAPQFFPQNAKSWSSYEDSKLMPEDPFSLLGTSSVAPPEVLPEARNFEEDFRSPVKYTPLWSPAHNDMSDHGNKPLQHGNEKFDFCFDRLLMEENYFRLITGLKMQTGFVGQENSGVPLLAAPNTSGTLTQQKNSVSVLSEPALIGNTPFGASTAINMSSKIDEEVLVDIMHDLSKLLLTKCQGERSFDKLNHERIRAVIGNLLICMEGGHAKSESMPELANLCILNNPPWKCADALTNTNSTILRKIPREMCGSSSNVNRTQQSSEKSPSAICFDEAKISPQAQLYKLLWLEAQSELLFLKSKRPPCA